MRKNEWLSKDILIEFFSESSSHFYSEVDAEKTFFFQFSDNNDHVILQNSKVAQV